MLSGNIKFNQPTKRQKSSTTNLPLVVGHYYLNGSLLKHRNDRVSIALLVCVVS